MKIFNIRPETVCMPSAGHFLNGGRTTSRFLILTLAVMALGVQVRLAPAKVYRRWGRADIEAIASGRMPGRLLYESAASMNGAAGHARVRAYNIDFMTVRTALSNHKSDSTDSTTNWMLGERHALGTAAAPPERRTLLIDLPDRNGILAVCFEPAAGTGPPGAVIPGGLPDYPGAEVHWSLELEASGLTVYTASANAGPEAVAAHFDRRLQRAGWRPALDAPRAAAAGPPPGGVYLKGESLMAVQVRPGAERGAPTALTVVRKQR